MEPVYSYNTGLISGADTAACILCPLYSVTGNNSQRTGAHYELIWSPCRWVGEMDRHAVDGGRPQSAHAASWGGEVTLGWPSWGCPVAGVGRTARHGEDKTMPHKALNTCPPFAPTYTLTHLLNSSSPPDCIHTLDTTFCSLGLCIGLKPQLKKASVLSACNRPLHRTKWSGPRLLEYRVHGLTDRQ